MFDWTSFLELAEELAKREGEAELRSSISRAYYAVFHTSRHLAEELGLQVPDNA